MREMTGFAAILCAIGIKSFLEKIQKNLPHIGFCAANYDLRKRRDQRSAILSSLSLVLSTKMERSVSRWSIWRMVNGF